MSDNVRLLVCFDEDVHSTARTIEEVPPYEGDPEHDVDLEHILASRHTYPDGRRHVGQLLSVERKHWENKDTRKQVIERIHESRGHTGFDKSFYDVKDNLAEDAAVCWQRHGRTKACIDYKSDAKRLSAGTEQARKDLGLAPLQSNRFLCDHCVVDTVVKSFANRNL